MESSPKDSCTDVNIFCKLAFPLMRCPIFPKLFLSQDNDPVWSKDFLLKKVCDKWLCLVNYLDFIAQLFFNSLGIFSERQSYFVYAFACLKASMRTNEQFQCESLVKSVRNKIHALWPSIWNSSPLSLCSTLPLLAAPAPEQRNRCRACNHWGYSHRFPLLYTNRFFQMPTIPWQSQYPELKYDMFGSTLFYREDTTLSTIHYLEKLL